MISIPIKKLNPVAETGFRVRSPVRSCWSWSPTSCRRISPRHRKAGGRHVRHAHIIPTRHARSCATEKPGGSANASMNVSTGSGRARCPRDYGVHRLGHRRVGGRVSASTCSSPAGPPRSPRGHTSEMDPTCRARHAARRLWRLTEERRPEVAGSMRGVLDGGRPSVSRCSLALRIDLLMLLRARAAPWSPGP
jgi:hypothetical protein